MQQCNNSDYNITPEIKQKLQNIYDYFGKNCKIDSWENKIERLFLECGEFRDAIILKQSQNKINKEITDLISCVLQMLFNEPLLQTQFDKTLEITLNRIGEGYYERD